MRPLPLFPAIDIDVLDPSAAPATGTPETGGWSTRELRTIIRGLEGLLIVGADIVEVRFRHFLRVVVFFDRSHFFFWHRQVATPYDSQAEITALAAADVLFEVMGLMVLRGPLIKANKIVV